MKRAAQQALVTANEDTFLRMRLHFVEELRTEHGDKHHGNEQRYENRDANSNREWTEKLADDAVDEGQRKEHDYHRQRGRSYGADYFLRCLIGKLLAAHFGTLLLAPSVNILDHDNTVVNDAPYRYRDAAKRHDIQGIPHLIQQRNRRKNRDRQRKNRNERCSYVAQEKEDNQDAEQCPEQAFTN